MTRTAHISPIEVSWPEAPSADGHHAVMLLRPVGEIDPEAGAALAAAIREAGAGANVVVDMSAVTSLSMAGAEVVLQMSALLAADGRRLVLAACPQIVAEVVAALAASVTAVPTVSKALSPPGPNSGDTCLLLRLRHEARTSPLIARTEGILTERYRLTGAEAASGLLRTISRQHRVSVRSLATAFLAAPRPLLGRPWFPGRRHTPPPAITFDGSIDVEATTAETLLDTVLDSALTCTDTTMGTVQLSSPAINGLVLEAQRGFSPEFRDFFAVVNDNTTVCAAARSKRTRVTVEDVASDPVFGDTARQVILSAGARSVQSSPMLDSFGHCIGIYSTHHTRPGLSYSQAQTKVLDTIAAQSGAWLDWHQQTTVLDALETLHERASMG